MEFENEKTYHLMSNAQLSLFPENCSNDFSNCIEPALQLPHGDNWEMGLKEFSCVNTLQTIPRDMYFYTSKGDNEKTVYKLADGMYNETGLMETLNQNDAQFHFSCKKITEGVVQVVLQTKQHHSLIMEPLLADILGLTPNVDKNSTQTASEPLHLKAFSYNIVVYCDIVQESVIGGQREKILRVIPFQAGKYYDVFHTEFHNVDYMNVKAVEVRYIRIRLMTDYGEKLPLRLGRTYAKVHFRRKASRYQKLSN